jgi:hypothetical protein
MPWTEITCAEYQRSGLRYASDMTDAEWAVIVRQLPPRRRLGRPRTVDLRNVWRDTGRWQGSSRPWSERPAAS